MAKHLPEIFSSESGSNSLISDFLRFFFNYFAVKGIFWLEIDVFRDFLGIFRVKIEF